MMILLGYAIIVPLNGLNVNMWENEHGSLYQGHGDSEGGKRVITTKDRIGYIRRQDHPDGTSDFKFIEAKIKAVRIGKKGTSVYSYRFRVFDAEELETNTKIMSDNSQLVLVGEPFITNDALSERLQKVVEHWNKHGAGTIFGNRTKPPKEEA